MRGDRSGIPSGFQFKGLYDPKYIESREKTFAKNGNGWWYGWTKDDTPIRGVWSKKDDKRMGYYKR